MTDIFTLDGLAWQLRLDGEVLPTTWNSKGAALAAIPIERKRAAKRYGVVDDSAALIIPAVNTHEELVAVLREFVIVTMYLPIPDADERQRVGAVQIRAADLLERIAA